MTYIIYEITFALFGIALLALVMTVLNKVKNNTNTNIKGKTYVTSDWHFKHKKMLEEWDDRPKDYEDQIISKYLSTVQEQDRVIFLGDMLFQPHKYKSWFADLIRSLPGRKILIRGNHDDTKRFPDEYWEDDCGFDIVYNNYILIGSTLLSHYPIINSNPNDNRFKDKTQNLHDIFIKEECIFNLHGHTHTYVNPDKRLINCCVDNTRLKPLDITYLTYI